LVILIKIKAMPLAANFDPGAESTRLIKLEDNNGGILLLEVRDREGAHQVAGGITFPVDDLVRSVKSLSHSLANVLKEIGPDKFAVEFGVEAAFESGKLLALICSGSAKANLKITLEWTKTPL
jgi:hypothetical protein